VVRDATPADAPAIREIALRAWPAAYEGLFDQGFIDLVLGRTYTVEALSGQIADPASQFLVAEDEGILVGYLHYAEGELYRLYVEPGLTGRGIGSELLAELNRRLPAGTEYVALVREGNHGALRFYEDRGFARAGYVDGFRLFLDREGLEAPVAGAGRDVLVRYVVP
jgi:ribosomal protein S18 acetylase RimI-like enzyme